MSSVGRAVFSHTNFRKANLERQVYPERLVCLQRCFTGKSVDVRWPSENDQELIMSLEENTPRYRQTKVALRAGLLPTRNTSLPRREAGNDLNVCQRGLVT